jgi:hypothetical protein
MGVVFWDSQTVNVMKINGDMNTGGLDGITSGKQPSTPAKTAASEPAFSASDALEDALSQVPDVRAEAVARAVTLINDRNYPPADTVKQLADFLASKLTSPTSAQN